MSSYETAGLVALGALLVAAALVVMVSLGVAFVQAIALGVVGLGVVLL